MRRALVTGATGSIATQVLPALRERCELVLLDIKDSTRDGAVVEGVTIADLADQEACRPHFEGIDTLVHSAYVWTGGQDEFEGEMHNIRLAHNAYQLAFEAGVSRVISVSSNHAADWYERPLWEKQLEMVYPEMPPRADTYYGWAKICYEGEGFLFACGALGRKMGVVQVRIGAPRELGLDRYAGDPVRVNRELGAWISVRDHQQLFVKSIEAPNIEDEYGVPFQIFYGISDNTRAFWSIANARRVVGYEPEDNSECEYAEDIAKYLIPRPRPRG
jgi:nucleoside-diphosphate-sugar epimerase